MKHAWKIISDAAFLFTVANLFVFWQSGSFAAVAITVVVLALIVLHLSGLEVWRKIVASMPPFLRLQFITPLYINGWGVLASALFALAAGGILSGIAGVAFAVGSFLAVSPRVEKIQHDPHAAGWLKALTHAAVYFGIGYVMIGLLAGGGAALFAHPFANIPALITTGLGVLTTTLSTIGMVTGAFQNPAAPFMAVSLGTFINMWAGIFSGNILGALNNFFPMLGEFRLAWDEQTRFEAHGAPLAEKSAGLKIVADILLLPLCVVRRFAV